MDFARYLEAKQALDDRSIHPRLWNTFLDLVGATPDVLDLGCGGGATLARLVDSRSVNTLRYTGIDREATLVERARERLGEQADATFLVADFVEFARSTERRRVWPLITAQAFLDLLDLGTALDAVVELLEPHGHVYFTLNFDDLTSIEPVMDPALDEAVLSAYHATMYAERWGGSGGESRTGRRLFHALEQRGFEVLDMAPSDWVIAPFSGDYQDEDALVLEYLVQHIVDVAGHAHTSTTEVLDGWRLERMRQIQAGRLVYIAHQLDIIGRR